MNQQILNIGLLNLINATEESVKGIERIENVGLAIYRQENAHLLSMLNIGNIGKTVEIPIGYRFYEGTLNLDSLFLQSISEPLYLFVSGMVIVNQNVQPEELKKGMLHLMVEGNILCPVHLSSLITHVISKGSFDVETYDRNLPRFESGKFNITNAFLQALEEPTSLVVNGVLTLSKDLNMEKFNEKISELKVNGKVYLYEEQELFFYKKMTSLATCKIEAIPTGFEELKKPLRLNARSIRRFHKKQLYTKKPIIFDKEVSREMLVEAIAKIHSTSVIICHEEIEDLLYEITSVLETEILSYQHDFLMIEGDEVWSNEQFLALEKPINMIVNGKLILDHDVTEDVLKNKVAALDLLGEVIVREKKQKGFLQSVLRVNTGSIEEEARNAAVPVLNNVGELSL